MTVPTEPPVPPTAGDLFTYVGGKAGTDQDLAGRKLAQAQLLVNRYVLDGSPAGTTDLTTVVPAQVLYEAYLEVGSALWGRRNAPGGTASYDGVDGPLTPLHADPLTTVYPDLDRYLRPGLA